MSGGWSGPFSGRAGFIAWTVVASLGLWATSPGTILGWGPLHKVLVERGEYAELCNAPTNNSSRSNVSNSCALPSSGTTERCDAQAKAINNIFEFGFVAMNAGPLLFGPATDIFGPRVSAASGLVLVAAGNALFAASSSAHFDGFVPAFMLIACGGNGPYLASFTLVRHAFDSRHSALALSMVTAMYNLSGFNYNMMLAMPSSPHRIHTFFTVMCALSCACLVASFLPLPHRYLDKDSPKVDSVVEVRVRQLGKYVSRARRMWHELLPCITSTEMWAVVAWLSVVILIVQLTTSNFPDVVVSYCTHSTAQAAQLISVEMFSTVGNSSFLFSAVVGWLIDKYGIRPMFAVGTGLTWMLVASFLTPRVYAQALTVVMFAVQKAVVLSCYVCFLGLHFPAEVSGSLIALGAGTIALVGVLEPSLIVPFTTATRHIVEPYFVPSIVLASVVAGLLMLLLTIVRPELRRSDDITGPLLEDGASNSEP